MHQIKIDNFLKEYPGRDFPSYVALDDKECENIRSSLFKNLELDPMVGRLELVKEVDKRSVIIDGIDCDDESFDLKQILSSLGLLNLPQFVYINWYRFDDIDQINLIDLAKYFDDIWHPGPDDIEIFDDSLKWILSVNHDGVIQVLRM